MAGEAGESRPMVLHALFVRIRQARVLVPSILSSERSRLKRAADKGIGPSARLGRADAAVQPGIGLSGFVKLELRCLQGGRRKELCGVAYAYRQGCGGARHFGRDRGVRHAQYDNGLRECL